MLSATLQTTVNRRRGVPVVKLTDDWVISNVNLFMFGGILMQVDRFKATILTLTLGDLFNLESFM